MRFHSHSWGLGLVAAPGVADGEGIFVFPTIIAWFVGVGEGLVWGMGYCVKGFGKLARGRCHSVKREHALGQSGIVYKVAADAAHRARL